ncbi:uncharacterized protein [Coffea arabica]|uniref:Integrase catalytic domain-containing protein n=1 Tax=Coffea arabica TaxID=13443 RepID=A0ABM4VZD2_COFAR
MYFDGSAHRDGAGAGVVFYTPEADILLFSFTLTRRCSNSVVEYHVLILGLETAVDMKQLHLRVYGDSKLVEDWRHLIIDYLNHGKLPEDPKKRVDIRRRAPRFIYYKGTLYRKLFDGVFLRCFGEDESMQAMEEAHSGICGAHQSGPKLHFRIKRMGYYWPTTVKDCIDFARRYQACQFHENFIHQPPKPLHPTVASWPFDAWGLDIVGSLPKSFGGHIFILAATNYFSKWAEAVFLREVKKENVVDFIRLHIIYRYGVPRYIITDNATPYALVYGVEAVLPLECQIPSLRIAIQEGFSEENNVRLRLEELEALDEKRLETQQRIECYQARLSKAFNKHVRPRSFQIGELVLAVRRPIILTHGGQRKFTPKWDGPYVVREVYTNGSYKLVAEDGLRVGPINGKYLKRYYA